MVRVIALIATLLSVILPTLADGETAPSPLRYSVAPGKVRVVLELPTPATITSAATANAITVTIPTALPQPVAPITLTDPAVTGVTVTTEQARTVLTVSLVSAHKWQAFTIPMQDGKPFRVVVDVFKTYTKETHRKLTPAITYTRLEKQTADRYFVAHLVEVNLNDPHVHLEVVAAEQERERVSAMVTRTHAVCGVNGGYFLGGTRPVGLLKVSDGIHSLPIWGRTAAAFPKTGLPVFANPTGVWKVTLPDSTTREMADWLDASVLPTSPTARVIPGTTIVQAPANPVGVTAIVRAGKVIARPTEATPLLAGDFALHLTGDDAKALDGMLTVGAEVTVTPVLSNPEWADAPYAVGAGPRLLRDGKLAVTADDERFQADIRNGRNARTGIGVTKKGHVVFAVVEEPGPYGGGATLEELAGLLKTYGAVDAMNFDGGGSSCLALDDETVNYAPNTWVRPVASGVLVFDERTQTTTARR